MQNGPRVDLACGKDARKPQLFRSYWMSCKKRQRVGFIRRRGVDTSQQGNLICETNHKAQRWRATCSTLTQASVCVVLTNKQSDVLKHCPVLIRDYCRLSREAESRNILSAHLLGLFADQGHVEGQRGGCGIIAAPNTLLLKTTMFKYPARLPVLVNSLLIT